MLIKIYPDNPNPKAISQVVDCLRDGGIVIYPTDTIYGIGCSIESHSAVDRIIQMKRIDTRKAHLSFICSDLSNISDYTRPISSTVFKLMKRNLPGPFTFILNANNNVPRLFKNKKKTVGIRIPDNSIIREIVRELGVPVLSASVRDEDEVIEYSTDPELIHEKFNHIADIVIDGGYGDNEPSTVVDCTGDSYEIVRQGKGILEE